MHSYHRHGMPVRYKYTESALRESASKSESCREFLLNLGIQNPRSGSMLSHLESRCAALGIDLTHLKRVTAVSPRRGSNRLPPSEVLVKGTPNGRRLPGRLLGRALVESGVAYQCVGEDCAVGSVWNGKPITLQVDHRNGDVTDNRKENLRFMCPNCHTQTPNWGTRNKPPEPTAIELTAIEPEFPVWPSDLPSLDLIARMVWEEAPKTLAKKLGVGYVALIRRLELSGHTVPNRRYWDYKRKGLAQPGENPPAISWPSDEELKELVWSVPMVHLAEKYGGTGNALKKHCKKQGIPFPGRGHWQAIAGEATRTSRYPSNSELERLLSEESMTKVATRCGVTFASLAKHCNKAGIKVH